MSTNIPKCAGMVPLLHDSRTEVVVSYFCPDWEELTCLLEAPLEYLRGQQFLWQQNASDSIPWQLLSPLTATIEYGLKNVQSLNRVISFVGNLAGPAIKGSIPPSKNSLSISDLEEWSVWLSGSFFVEFAIYTNSIRILYFPPALKVVKAKEKKNGGPRYSGKFIEPTLVNAEFQKHSSSYLHFDLSETSHRMRADYIVNYLEDPQHICELLTTRAYGPILQQAAKMTDVNVSRTSIHTPTTVPTQLPSRIAFVPGIDFRLISPHVIDPSYMRFLEKTGIYGTVVAHNLSDPMLRFVCNNITCQPIVVGNVTTLALGSTVVEAYSRTLFDPAFVVRHFGNPPP